MNLPVILDIAIGLMFIFLIASLLASEIQELLAALLQWRAKHLKDSIQNLIAGGYGTQDSDRVRDFVEAIYNDPLIKSLNQSSRGLIGRLGQAAYQIFYGKNKIFGANKTAPSYISSETFATSLLEQVGMASLIGKLTEIRLEKFIGRIVGLYTVEETADPDTDTVKRTIHIPSAQEFEQKDNWEKGGIRVLAEKARALAEAPQTIGETANAILTLDDRNPDFVALVEEYDDLLMDFKAGQVNIRTCVERMQEGLKLFISQVGEKIPAADPQIATGAAAKSQQDFERKQLDYFHKRLKALNSSTFGENSARAIASGKLSPNLLEIAEVFDRSSMTYKEIERAFQDAKAAYEASSKATTIRPVWETIAAKVNELARTRNAANSGQTDPLAFGMTSISTASTIAPPITIEDLLSGQYQTEVEEVLRTLTPKEQDIYRQTYQDQGWKQYQQIILKVIQNIADQLQNGGTASASNDLGRLFSSDKDTYDYYVLAYPIGDTNRFSPAELKRSFVRRWQDLDDATLIAYVKHSLSKLFDEERQMYINAALSTLSLDQRKIYKNYQTYDQIQDFLSRVPPQVKQSLAILARRAYVKVQETERQLDQFREEVSAWFDRSMSRASGVYKRNAKLVAIVIGILIALIINIDTFHIISRLSVDEDLRQAITQNAGGVPQSPAGVSQASNPADLRALVQKTAPVLEQVALPIQWTPTNLRQQFGCSVPQAQTGTSNPAAANPVSSPTATPSDNPATTPPQPNPSPPATEGGNPRSDQTGVVTANIQEWQQFYRDCLPQSHPDQKPSTEPPNPIAIVSEVALKRPWSIPRMAMGWLISGLAISMGAPFWFDLLSKIMNVRNTGSRPASTTDKQNPNPPT